MMLPLWQLQSAVTTCVKSLIHLLIIAAVQFVKMNTHNCWEHYACVIQDAINWLHNFYVLPYPVMINGQHFTNNITCIWKIL